MSITKAELITENARLRIELTEALEQQTATSEILRVISSSRTNLQPMLDAIATNAARVCGAYDAEVLLRDGDLVRIVAHHGPLGAWSSELRPLNSGFASGRAILAREPVHVHDILGTEAVDLSVSKVAAEGNGFRTLLAMPLLREGDAIGSLTIRRREVQPFTEKQLALLQTFADQAVIAIENVRLFKELESRNRDLTEALEQQTATGDILKVISQSPTDVQPVFEAIAESALRLCDAKHGVVFLFDGELIHLAAITGTERETTEAARRSFPQAPGRASATTRAIQTLRAVVIPDVLEDPEFQLTEIGRVTDFRSVMSVPMLRGGKPIGAVTVTRAAAAPFPDTQVALLQTFADQAVIAIENVRLFTELQTSNRELTTALDQQTATSDILRVISRSQTDVQPVFDAIVESAVRLLGGHTGELTRIADNQVELAALTSTGDAGNAAFKALFPRPLHAEGTHAEAIRDRAPVNLADANTDPRLPETLRAAARARGFRSRVVVPMLHHDQAVGAIAVTRREPGGFTQDEIALLRTFADQALIAIENVRLFTELEARNHDLTEALEQQTATSELLKVIGRSAFDLQPVFDMLAENAVRLCEAERGGIFRFDGRLLRLVAGYNISPELWAFIEQNPPEPGRHTATARAALERRTIHIHDVLDDPEYTYGVTQVDPVRTVLTIPLLWAGELLGVINIYRFEVRPFSDSQIALLETFADQAAIAIENSRLLTELQARTQELSRSVDELRALGEVGQAISSTLDLQTVLSTIVARATQLSGTDAGVIYEYDEQREVFVPRASEHLGTEIVETMLATPVRKGEGATGQLAEIQEPIQVPDMLEAPAESRVRGALARAGYRALLAVPLVWEDHLLGGLTVIRKTTGEFAPEVIDLLRTFATQSALAIQNARLFLEIEAKSRELEAASRHKSEFLANMSHELRTPLNAILGFSEVLAQGMFGEVNEKQTEYLHDILESGRHLLSLINDILDLSKIEAGRMELELTDFDLPQAIQNALTLVRERALRREITLHHVIDDRVASIRADGRKVKQVLLNLLSNAIKFTPEGGRIEVRAAPADGAVEVSVADTGIGIAPEDQAAVFEEFRQVGTADKKAEGTGLGLTLSRKFIELHGGKIWVHSEVGHGSTFTFTLPVRP